MVDDASPTIANPAEPEVPVFDVERLRPFCRRLSVAPGDVLRRKGQHYRDMYLMIAGTAEVDFRVGTDVGRRVIVVSGGPVGEIGFLRGSAAVATVTARTAAEGLILDDPLLAQMERNEPALAADLFRYLARTAAERTSFNLTLSSLDGAAAEHAAIDVYLCRDEEMLRRAKRLRYEVYCDELGRDSPYADHKARTISDHLDEFGNTFIAVDNGETIGTLRSNVSREGDLGHLADVYGMPASPHHPNATAICTKFIVRKGWRGGPASIRLISALVGLGLRSEIKACYIDSIPALLPYYRAIGFVPSAPIFFHRENGPSHPLALDLVEHGDRLAKAIEAGDHLKMFLRTEASRARSGGFPP